MTMLDTYDKDGDGIWFQAFGVADVPGLLKRFGRKELAKYFLWVQERAAEGPWGQIYEKKMKRAPRVTVVIDLEGFNRGHAKPAAFVVYEDILCMIQNYYCMFVKKIIFVREPAIFRMIWPGK